MKRLFNLILVIFALFVLGSCQTATETEPIPIGRSSTHLASTMTPTRPTPTIAPTMTATPTITETIVTAEFIQYVALVSIEEQVKYAQSGYQSPDGSIITYFANRSEEPTNVWRFSQGALEEVDIKFHYQAVGYNSALWPPYTYSFSFELIEPDLIVVYLVTHYDSGITEHTRGGNSKRITLRRIGDNWVELRRETVMRWD